jgi:hypothetical protein
LGTLISIAGSAGFPAKGLIFMSAFSIIFAISSHLQIRQLPHFEIGFG